MPFGFSAKTIAIPLWRVSIKYCKNDGVDSRLQMKISMTTKWNISSMVSTTKRKYSPMQEPRAGIVGNKPYCHIVSRLPDTHDIPTHRVHIIIVTASGSSDDTEGML